VWGSRKITERTDWGPKKILREVLSSKELHNPVRDEK